MRVFHPTILLYFVVWLMLAGCTKDKIDFSAEVKPILNKRCIACHGGVKKSGGFSVLFRDEAIDTTESRKPAIVPDHPELSEVIRRINSSDPEYRMPYKEDPLTQKEIDILTRWIEEGANWGEHWAYQKPESTDIPSDKNLFSSFGSVDAESTSNEIDHFILAALKDAKLEPSPTADKSMLVRRIYLDVTGVPPTVEEANEFINSTDPQAYEKLVDKLLASPRYGEKWASWWLDLARYSDTKGYERDVERTIWRYRDWVIRAFNNDMPFDQFTVEQLAGDLLPNPTDDQLIATAFHRNTMNNDEGGTEDEEFRVAALLDRVNTTWEVWQSTTFACIQCHSHPYDPFVHDDYYKSMAFFNNTRDEDVLGEHPNLRTYTQEDQQKVDAIRKWIEENTSAEKAAEVNRFLRTLEPKYHPHDFDDFVNAELIDTKMLGVRAGGRARLKNINLENKKYLLINYACWNEGGTLQVRTDRPDGKVIGSIPLKTTKGYKAISIDLAPTTGKHDLYFLLDNKSLRGTNQPVSSIEWFAFREALPTPSLDKSFLELVNSKVENTPIMIENNEEQKRKTTVFERGNWLVKGAEVDPGTPAILNHFPENQPLNRLGFARWLTSKDNPLTARTIVNRVWEQIFGNGIVITLEDFGSQGEAPSHPELLDWLSIQMMEEYNWSIKELVKKIVMSSTYRQDSHVSPEQLEKDPFNRLLGRGARVRLSAEQVRDQALQVSGLLSDKMYGPGVMPYQPSGIWNSVWSGAYWKKSAGEDQYRRSIYTFHKRTSPYPSMMLFDGSSREVCLSRRIRTNTPLQALVTLNDSVFVEASAQLAKKISKRENAKEQIRDGYRTILFKDISEDKLAVLHDFYEEALATYRKNPTAVAQLTKDSAATPHYAAMIVVANAMLNLDEVIMKE